MKIAITGSTGLIGSALSKHLRSEGNEVTAMVRSSPGDGEIGWAPDAGRLDPADLAGIDAVVHLAGAGIGARRWTDAYRQELVDSRVKGTSLLAEAVAAADDGPSTVISASAVGYYGDRGDEILTEESSPGEGFLPDLCQRWEQAMQPAIEAGVRVATIRTGIVLSTDGGALPRMLPLFKFGLGGRFGDGAQYMPWVSLDDTVAAIAFLLDHQVAGPVNLTGPDPVTNATFTRELGDVLNRPTWLTVPAFAPKMLLGKDMAQSLLFDSVRVQPNVLTTSGFRFTHPTLRAALTAEID